MSMVCTGSQSALYMSMVCTGSQSGKTMPIKGKLPPPPKGDPPGFIANLQGLVSCLLFIMLV